MAAECLGSLTCLQPKKMLKKLVELQEGHSEIIAQNGAVTDNNAISKKNSLVCWTVAFSIKLAIAAKVDAMELSVYMPTFVKLLEMQEVNC